MIGQFNELLRVTADEGASATIGDVRCHTLDESDQLLDAWFRERQVRVETELFLEEAHHLLKGVIHDGQVTPTSRRKIQRFLLAIKSARPIS